METRPFDFEAIKQVKGQFVDFSKFEGEAAHRRDQKRQFMHDEVWVPEYDYPRLDSLYDEPEKASDSLLSERKQQLQGAVMALEAAKTTEEHSEATLELWASYFENRLQKIMLVEAAKRLHSAGDSATQHVAQVEFQRLNQEIYGEYDVERFRGMIATEQKTAEAFQPADAEGEKVKSWLTGYFEKHDYHDSREAPLMSEELLGKLKDTLLERYAGVLAVVPETDDTVYYDAQQCQQIMTAALTAGGLAEKGWIVEIDSKKSNPSTSAEHHKISLPGDTRRTASELRRLIIHEQEVHARRGQNGEETGSALLKNGTANYADVEEGLGVLLECALAGSLDNPSFHRARDRYIVAGLALGADGTPRDARQTYEATWQMIAVREARDGAMTPKVVLDAKKRAMAHVENAYRSTNFAARGIIYTKLKVYFEGLSKNADFFAEYADNLNEALDIAMVAKSDHTDPIERQNVQDSLALAT